MRHEGYAQAYLNAEYAASFPFIFKPVQAPSIYVSVCSNPLKLTVVSLYRLFTNIHRKYIWRKMDFIYRS